MARITSYMIISQEYVEYSNAMTHCTSTCYTNFILRGTTIYVLKSLHILIMSALLVALLSTPTHAQQEYTITAYCLTGVMRDGTYTRDGSIAADLRIHPLGTVLYVEDLGTYVVRDSGGGVLGWHVDIWFPSCTDALNFGRQYRNVWVQP